MPGARRKNSTSKGGSGPGATYGSQSRKQTRRAQARQGSRRVILVNKPYGVLCKFSDAEGRPTLKDHVNVSEQVYPAGRLDMDSEGLVLLTDDGWLAHRVTHPRHKLPKVYLVQVEGIPDQAALRALEGGVVVKGRRTAPARVDLVNEPELWPRENPVRPHGDKRWLRLVLQEGRKRQVRHMTAAIGHPTLRLVRVAIGPLALGTLQPGQWRDITPEELRALRAALVPGQARSRSP